jgi:hypothetical protein
MSKKSLLDSLADHAVPPVPAELNRRVHQRLNRVLLAGHLLDLAVGCVPFVMSHLLHAVGQWLKVSAIGWPGNSRRDGSREAP